MPQKLTCETETIHIAASIKATKNETYSPYELVATIVKRFR